jgi:hypothetical protein
MTYCFAWKYQDAVCLIADTLVTQGVPAPADSPMTSLGEPHRQLGKDFVHERLLKIRELKDGVAVALAGDVQLAFKIIDFIEDHIKAVDRAADLLSMIGTSMGPFEEDRYVQLLLVQGAKDGEPLITKWDTLGKQENAANAAYIGSLPPAQADRMGDLFQRLIADKSPSKDAMLLAGMAYVESLSMHEDLIEYHVGGVVCGLRVQRGETIWPGDIMVVQHRDDFSSLDGQISVHAREGIVCINSTHLGSTASILVNKHESMDTDDEMHGWISRWFPYLREYLKDHFITCTRWLFLNLDRQVSTTFVAHLGIEKAGRLLRITQNDKGEHSIQLGSELLEMLKRTSLADRPDLRILDAIELSEPRPDGMPTD